MAMTTFQLFFNASASAAAAMCFAPARVKAFFSVRSAAMVVSANKSGNTMSPARVTFPRSSCGLRIPRLAGTSACTAGRICMSTKSGGFMSKRILVVTGDGGEGYEALYACHRFLEAGHTLVVAAPSKRRLHLVMHDFEPGWDTYIERPGYGLDADAS